MGWGARFAGVLVVGVVLSGCGSSAGPEPQVLSLATGQPTGEDAPSPAESTGPTATADPTVSAEPSPDDLPDAAREHSALGAQAFVRHYIDKYNEAMRTGSTDSLMRLGDSGCRTCLAYVAQVSDGFADGGRIEGGQVTVLNSGAPILRDAESFLVEVRVSISEERDLDRSGKTISTFSSAKELSIVFYPRWERRRWIVTEIKAGIRK